MGERRLDRSSNGSHDCRVTGAHFALVKGGRVKRPPLSPQNATDLRVNMRKVGLIVLAVAVLIGVTAIWGLFNLQKARASANNATVVVAARSIDIGQSLTPDMLRLQAWPANAIPEGAFTTIADVAGAEPRV